jgi:hypothetical protein
MTPTRDLVTIGQRWRLRDRRRTNPTIVTILQVWRADRSVLLRHPDGQRRSVPFAELRRRYELLER